MPVKTPALHITPEACRRKALLLTPLYHRARRMSMCVFACLGRDSGPLYIQKGKARKTQYAMPQRSNEHCPRD